MVALSWDTSEVKELARDLVKIPPKTLAACEVDVRESARAIVNGWVRRATDTAGEHGKLYPRSISAEVKGLDAIIGPESGMPQGGMGRGFEWGGPSVLMNITPGQIAHGAYQGMRVGQHAPHLDMTQTVDEEAPKFLRRIENTVDKTVRL